MNIKWYLSSAPLLYIQNGEMVCVYDTAVSWAWRWSNIMGSFPSSTHKVFSYYVLFVSPNWFFYDYVYFVSWKIPYFSTRAKPHPPCECKEECRIFKRLSKMFLYDRIYVITVGNLSFLFNLRMLSLSLNLTLLAVSYLSSHSLIVIISIYIFFALPVYGMTSICGRWEENVLTICVCSALWSICVLKWTTRWWNGIRIHKLHEHL